MTTITNIANDQQLELGFNGGLPRHSRFARRERRLARAAWWFNKMREVVNAATVCPSENAPRPEQTLLPGSYRQIRF